MTDEKHLGKTEQMRAFVSDTPILEIKRTGYDSEHAEFYTYAQLSDATYRFYVTMPSGDTIIGHRVAFDVNINDAKRKVASMIEQSYPGWRTMKILTREEAQKK